MSAEEGVPCHVREGDYTETEKYQLFSLAINCCKERHPGSVFRNIIGNHHTRLCDVCNGKVLMYLASKNSSLLTE